MVKNSLPGQKPPSITRRETEIDPFEDTFEDPFEDAVEDTFEDTFDDALEDAFQDPFDDDLIDEGDDAFDDAFDVENLMMVVPILNNAKIRSNLASSAQAIEILESRRPMERRSPRQN